MAVRNLEVIKAMQSLTSKGFVKTQFSWQWYYYTLTDEGLAYLREYLNIPSEIVPQTHMKPTKPAGRPSGYGGGERREGAYKAPRGGDREYRRRDDAGDKEGASGDFRPVSPCLSVAMLYYADSVLEVRRCRPRCRCSPFLGTGAIESSRWTGVEWHRMPLVTEHMHLFALDWGYFYSMIMCRRVPSF